MHRATDAHTKSIVQRRTLMAGTAWTVPAVLAGAAAPWASASGCPDFTPSLALSQYTFTGPSPFTATITVTNVGGPQDPTKAIYVSMPVTSDYTYSCTAPDPDTCTTSAVEINYLGVIVGKHYWEYPTTNEPVPEGGSFTFSAPFTWSSGATAGTHTINVHVEDESGGECNFLNNSHTKAATFTIPAPDFTVALGITPAQLPVDATASGTLQLTEVAGGSATGPVRVRIAKDQVLDWSTFTITPTAAWVVESTTGSFVILNYTYPGASANQPSTVLNFTVQRLADVATNTQNNVTATIYTSSAGDSDVNNNISNALVTAI